MAKPRREEILTKFSQWVHTMDTSTKDTQFS
jgi:hypothetical protein